MPGTNTPKNRHTSSSRPRPTHSSNRYGSNPHLFAFLPPCPTSLAFKLFCLRFPHVHLADSLTPRGDFDFHFEHVRPWLVFFFSPHDPRKGRTRKKNTVGRSIKMKKKRWKKLDVWINIYPSSILLYPHGSISPSHPILSFFFFFPNQNRPAKKKNQKTQHEMKKRPNKQ